MGAHLRTLNPRTSQHYGTEGFKVALNRGPIMPRALAFRETDIIFFFQSDMIFPDLDYLLYTLYICILFIVSSDRGSGRRPFLQL